MRYLAFLAILFITGTALAQTKLKKYQISKEIEVQLPNDFSPLPDEGIAREYPTSTKPLAVYSSPDGQVDFSVLQKGSQFRPQDLGMLREFYKASLLQMFTKVAFIRQEVTNVNGQEFLTFEFVSSLEDERQSGLLAPVQKYSIVQYTILENDPITVRDNQLISFTFHVPFVMKSRWQETGNKIMNSIKIKQKK